jgi:hypothetical protein
MSGASGGDQGAGTINATGLYVNGVAVTGSGSFRGALVYTSSPTTISGSGRTVSFNSETYDTDGIHDNTTNNTRLTVPSGVTKVRLSGAISTTGLALGASFRTKILKNAVGFREGGGFNFVTEVSSAGEGRVDTGVISVSSGDYFELHGQTTSGSFNTDNNYTWFAMEIVE